MDRDIRTVVVLEHLPSCDFCKEQGIDRPARFDFRTRRGTQWAFGCAEHYERERLSARLGVGSGQMLLVPDDPLLDPR